MRRMTDEPRWDPDGYARHARFVSDLGAGVVELLAPQPGECILDLGCGDGVITRQLAEAGCRVVGVDASPEQVAAARALGVDARLGSGEDLAFDAEFDAVFSNAALHWMRRADRVIAGVSRALVAGGRFVGEMGGHGCVARIRAALIAALDRRGIDGAAADPWYFPTAEDYGARLAAQGFRVHLITLFPRPTPLPGDVVGWLETFAQTFSATLPPAERPAYLSEVRDALRPTLCDASGQWTADYVRLRWKAVKPPAEVA